MNRTQLIENIIDPVIRDMGCFSPQAVDLLVMIAAHESREGHYLAQISGPAIGIYQMEPATHDEIIQYLRRNNYDLYERLNKWTGIIHHSLMAGNLYYATFMARAFFLRYPDALPRTHPDMAAYAKMRWNTAAGKATAEDYLNAFNEWRD